MLNVVFDERMRGPPRRVATVAEGLRAQKIETIAVMPRGSNEFAELLAGLDVRFGRKPLRRLRQTFTPVTHIQWMVSFVPPALLGLCAQYATRTQT